MGKYLSKCSDGQIKELMECYATFTDIDIERGFDGEVAVEIMHTDGIPESYVLDDYNVIVYDWDDTDTDSLLEYRKKMLSFFGNQYAVDYLLQTAGGDEE